MDRENSWLLSSSLIGDTRMWAADISSSLVIELFVNQAAGDRLLLATAGQLIAFSRYRGAEKRTCRLQGKSMQQESNRVRCIYFAS